jgi:argininosuccinate lyase
VKGISGEYFMECRPAKSSPLSYNKDLQERFWELAETFTGTA